MTSIVFKQGGKIIKKEDTRDIFECLHALIKWRDDRGARA